MKKFSHFFRFLFLITFFLPGISIYAQHSISGFTKYAHKTTAGLLNPLAIGNPAGTCDSIRVFLFQENVIIDTACPDQTGFYSFTGLANGTYSVEAQVNKKWGGVGSADASAILRNFVQLNGFSFYPPGYFTNIYLLAGDANGLGVTPNALDALLFIKRFVGLIPNFLPPYVSPGRPDYTSERHIVVLDGTADKTQDILTLCTGDVNGTYTPYY